MQNKPVHASTFGSSVRLCSEMVERVRTAVIPAKLFLFIRLQLCNCVRLSAKPIHLMIYPHPTIKFEMFYKIDNSFSYKLVKITNLKLTKTNPVAGSLPIQPKSNLRMWWCKNCQQVLKIYTLTQLRTTIRVQGTYTLNCFDIFRKSS